jgi:ABC-type Zn uptake system ZnuABC Zn-binding protein ZnuA
MARFQTHRSVSFAVLLAAAAVGTSCRVTLSEPRSANEGRPNVVTTVSPITSIVASVVGDLAEVRGLVPEGANSHTFEPPPSAARILSEADVLFVNGLMLEDPIQRLAGAHLPDGVPMVELGNRTISPDRYVYDFSFPEEEGKPNPHLWTNPPFAKDYARIVRDTMAGLDPTHAEDYRANYERFAAKVDALDGAMKSATATVPRPDLLTYHDAYAYFAQHYGWRVIGAVQMANFEEPTPRAVGALIDQVRQIGVPAIFGSEVFPSPVLARIAAESGARYVDKLRDDDLPGEPGDPGHSWLGLMKYNFVTMVEGLGGNASALRAVDVADGGPDRARYAQ